jgi:prephenate dehydratase
MRLGFLGPPGTYTHAALLASPRSAGAEAVAFGSERATILAAATGEVTAALVPIENALEGGVNVTLDTIVLDAPGVRIVGEEVLPVSHMLIARKGVALGDLTAVTSHPQALAQCRRFLTETLGGVRTVGAPSTAEAVRIVAGGDEPWAAIGTPTAAGLFGAVVLAEGIEDEPGNETRFVWVSAASAPFGALTTVPTKTSVVFHGPGDDSPGWLVRCLSEISSRDINLSRIESRPRKERLGHYLFLVDLEGAADDAPVAAAIDGLHTHCDVVRVLGSYAAAVRT